MSYPHARFEILPMGDSALLINFDQKISRKVNNQVFVLSKYIANKGIEGITTIIPAYCSITIGYDSTKWDFDDLSERLFRFADKKIIISPSESKHWSLPVCYGPFGLDLHGLVNDLKIPLDDLIRLHTSRTYDVFMLGFLPGFVYLGELPRKLHCHRKQTPRLKVPAQSVAIAGSQTGIYPYRAPGGWQIIGKTPVKTFLPNEEDPFLIKMGDQISFFSVGKAVYEEIDKMPPIEYRKAFIKKR